MLWCFLSGTCNDFVGCGIMIVASLKIITLVASLEYCVALGREQNVPEAGDNGHPKCFWALYNSL